ncbi:MAG: hypothetical protein AAGF15_04810 [Pseudomonadota bacterium]
MRSRSQILQQPVECLSVELESFPSLMPLPGGLTGEQFTSGITRLDADGIYAVADGPVVTSSFDALLPSSLFIPITLDVLAPSVLGLLPSEFAPALLAESVVFGADVSFDGDVRFGPVSLASSALDEEADPLEHDKSGDCSGSTARLMKLR